MLGVDEGTVAVTATWKSGKTLMATARANVSIECARRGIAREMVQGATGQGVTTFSGVYALTDHLLGASVQDTATMADPDVPGRHALQLIRFCMPRQSRVVYRFDSPRAALVDTIPRSALDSIPALPARSSSTSVKRSA